MKHKRPLGLVLIVSYKAVFAAVLAVTSLSLALALSYANFLQSVAESCLLEGKLAIVEGFVAHLLRQDAQTLHYASIVIGTYAGMTVIEAVGLWYQKLWAEAMVAVLVGVSIAPEIYELVKGATPLKLGIFAINLAIFIYLLRFLRRQVRSHPSKSTKT